MNIDVYLFGDLGKGYTQYINDDRRTLFESIAYESEAISQLIIHRDDTLMYYIYIRRLYSAEFLNNVYIGISYVLNNRFIRDIDGLFNIFEGAITTIVSRGVLLKYTNNGDIIPSASMIYNAKSEFAHISAYLKNELEMFLEGKNDILPPLNYAINTFESTTFKFNDSRKEILEALSEFPTIYIFKDANYENKESMSYSSTLRRLNVENNKLQEENKILRRQKNKIIWVLILLSVIFIGSIAFFFAMQSKNDTIFDLQEEKINQENRVEELQKNLKDLKLRLNLTIDEKTTVENALKDSIVVIKNLRSDNTQLTYNYQQLERRYSDCQINLEKTKSEATKYLNQLSSLQFGITNIEISNRYEDTKVDIPYGGRIEASKAMFLKTLFECYGSENNQMVQFVLKLFYPNGNLIWSLEENRKKGYTFKEAFVLKKGKNLFEFPGIGWSQRGNYSAGKYRCEIWANDIKLCEKQFTLY